MAPVPWRDAPNPVVEPEAEVVENQEGMTNSTLANAQASKQIPFGPELEA
jgi:hypothetical protein